MRPGLTARGSPKANGPWSTTALLVGAALVSAALVGYAGRPAADGEPFFAGPRKVWSHRTLAGGAAEDSLEGLQRAFDLGAAGGEIDVQYDARAKQCFVISEEAAAVGGAATLALDEALRAVPATGFIWLDFWNLKDLPDDAAEEAADSLARAVDRARMRRRVIVESMDAGRLGRLATAGLRTSLWVVVRPVSSGRGAHLLDLLVAAARFRAGPFSAVSMESTHYDGWVGVVFGGVPIHLFTVNDAHLMGRLACDPRVRIVLSDSPVFFGLVCRTGEDGARAPAGSAR